MKINILKKGDKVLFVNHQFVAVQRKNGEVDLIPLSVDENNVPIVDIQNIVTISYGDNSIEASAKTENGEITVTTF